MLKTICVILMLALTAFSELTAESNDFNQENKSLESKPKSIKALPIVKGTNNKVSSVTLQNLTKLRDELSAMADDVSCQTNNQCFAVATGASPCGGASGYQILSTVSTNKQRAIALSEKVVAIDKQLKAQQGIAGICQHLEKPMAICKGTVCQASSTPAVGLSAFQ